MTAPPLLTAPDLETVHEVAGPLDAASIVGALCRGPGDPCHQITADRAIWRTSSMPEGPVSYRLVQLDRHRVHCQAWGPGSGQLIAGLGSLLGEDDDPSTFTPQHPLLHDAHRRHPGLRIPRTRRVMEALVPAILEQKVTGKEAFRAWRLLVGRHGSPAPGPAPANMRTPPTAERWRMVPSWDFHRAGVDPQRSRTIVSCARLADQLEKCSTVSPAEATVRMRSIPGIGEWTAAEVAQRALGDADALSVGDFHLSRVIGWSMLGRPLTDPEMVEYLAPWQPHRYRVVRLLEVSGSAVKPRFAPRITIQDHRRH